MSILSNKDWQGATVDKRIIEKSVKRCIVGDIRETAPDAGNGEPTKGPKETVLINLHLDEPAKTVDGEEVRAGFPVVGRINVWEGREEEAMGKVKELACALLGLDRKTKDDVATILEQHGGWPAMKGKAVTVTFDTRKAKNSSELFQEISRYDRVAEAK